MNYLKKFLTCFVFFLTLFIGSDSINASAAETSTQIAVVDDALLTPLAPKVKNYLEDGKTSPTYDLKGAGNVQLLNVGPKRISDLVFGFMGVITIIVALRAGVSVLFSKGDAAKFKNGIMAIIYAAIGIVLIGSAWIIVRLVLDINLGSTPI